MTLKEHGWKYTHNHVSDVQELPGFVSVFKLNDINKCIQLIVRLTKNFFFSFWNKWQRWLGDSPISTHTRVLNPGKEREWPVPYQTSNTWGEHQKLVWDLFINHRRNKYELLQYFYNPKLGYLTFVMFLFDWYLEKLLFITLAKIWLLS